MFILVSSFQLPSQVPALLSCLLRGFISCITLCCGSWPEVLFSTSCPTPALWRAVSPAQLRTVMLARLRMEDSARQAAKPPSPQISTPKKSNLILASFRVWMGFVIRPQFGNFCLGDSSHSPGLLFSWKNFLTFDQRMISGQWVMVSVY